MPGKIIGIDIHSDSITAVVVEGGLKGFSIKDCAIVMINDGEGLVDGLMRLNEQIDFKVDTCICSIPGERISYRNLTVPFKSLKKIKQTLGFTIETMVPFPIEDLLIDFNILNQMDNSEILAASASKMYISQYLSDMNEVGIDPDVLDIRGVPLAIWLLRQEWSPENGMLLEIGSGKSTIVLYLKRKIILIRVFSTGMNFDVGDISNDQEEIRDLLSQDARIRTCLEELYENIQNTVHSFRNQYKTDVALDKIFLTGVGSLYPEAPMLLEQYHGVPVERVDMVHNLRVHMHENISRHWNPALMDGALSLALRDVKKDSGFNFRKDEFEVRKGYSRMIREIKKVASFMIIIISLLIADFGMDYYFQKRHYAELDAKIKNIFRMTFPDVKRIVDPVHQMRVKINEVKKSEISILGIGEKQKVIDLLREISVRMPDGLDMKVTRMLIDKDTFQIKGETDTFNTVDIIKKGMEKSEYFNSVTINSANLDRSGKRVTFELKLNIAR